MLKPALWSLFGFCWSGNDFVWTTLPFGWNESSFIHHALAKRAPLHQEKMYSEAGLHRRFLNRDTQVMAKRF